MVTTGIEVRRVIQTLARAGRELREIQKKEEMKRKNDALRQAQADLDKVVRELVQAAE